MPSFSENLLCSVLVSLPLLLLLATSLEAAPQASLVRSLPGFKGTFPSKHYSGYITLDSNPPKNLFYYFVVSERNPSEDPVVLWLNGGPGCSSFDGFVYEHGPFNFEKGKEKGDLPILHLNPHSWSKVSNIIYLDSPSGVGFSFPTQPSGDLQTAADSHAFLLKWFEQFPEFQANPFYIGGESYAGVYVPTLAAAVDEGIRRGAKPHINLKGYLVGNGVSDPHYDGDYAFLSFVHGMGLISDQLFEEAEIPCRDNRTKQENDPEKCHELLSKINNVLGDLNIYDILEPCFHGDEAKSLTRLPQSFQELGKSTERPLPVRTRMFGRAWPFRAPVRAGKVPTWPELMNSQSHEVNVPCFNDLVATAYLNDASVRKAIHASPEAKNWSLCADLDYNSDAGSMIPYHKNLTTKGYRALIYSGDHDMCVPFTGTQAWTAALGYHIVEEWRFWLTDDQVAGYLQGYAHNLTFLTIKGAGHTVPEYKPREALHFFEQWTQGKKI